MIDSWRGRWVYEWETDVTSKRSQVLYLGYLDLFLEQQDIHLYVIWLDKMQKVLRTEFYLIQKYSFMHFEWKLLNPYILWTDRTKYPEI